MNLGPFDIDRARAFYDALLAEIGGRRVMEFPQNGFTMYGTGGRSPGLAVTRPYDQQEARPGNGNMVALVMDSTDKVDAFHAKAIELGVTDEGAPGYRGDPKFGYYFGYFRDPDGHKLAAFNIRPKS